MTLVVSWIGIDTHGATSAYIVSDSRFTFPRLGCFDYGKKVFASKKYPELFGYAGDVLFPTVILSQIVEMIDAGLLITPNMTCEEKHKVIVEKIRYSLSKYPVKVLGESVIKIIHISRDSFFDGYPSFHNYVLSYNPKKTWVDEEILIPKESGLLHVLGSGKTEFCNKYQIYQNLSNYSTSRNVYQCFVDTLKNIKDINCGGAPQLVGLYRKPLSNGINYGIVYKRKRYLLGMEIPKDSSFENVDWRNELFEICDGKTKKIVHGATRQPKPKSVI